MIELFWYNPTFVSPDPSRSPRVESVAWLVADNPLEPESTLVRAWDGVASKAPAAANSPKFTVFPVGLNLLQRNVIPASSIRGQEENGQAIDLENWLIPFDDVVKLLDIKVKILDNGQLELQSPGFLVRISPAELTQDPTLGLTIAVSKIQSLLGVPVTFDPQSYALKFSPSWLSQPNVTINAPIIPPINLEGLPLIEAPDLSLSALGFNYQSLGNSTNPDGLINTINHQSQLMTVGSILGGSWFARVDQNALENLNDWYLAELQYLRQTPQADYVAGSQLPFWTLQDGVDYWGFTTIQRFGFIPPLTENLNTDQNAGFIPQQRLQSNLAKRTITGTAPPGTLVQLRQAKAKQAIAEVLVDESGSYRFETTNVIRTPQAGSSSGQRITYQVFLYPDGKRTEEPEIRETTFLQLPLQLPVGSSALVSSVGVGRNFLDRGFFGEFNQLKGGVGYFYGVTEDLTLGTGLVQDSNTLPSASVIYQPQGIPLGVSLTSLLGTDNDQRWAYSAGLSYYPNDDITLNINSTNINQDDFVQSFQFTWRTSPNLSLRFAGNDRENILLAGINYFNRIDDLYISTGISYDTQSSALWQGILGLDRWKLTSFGGGVNTLLNSINNHRFYSNSELSYNFSQWYGTGHAIFLSYNTDSNNNQANNFLSAGWRYQSPELTYDSRPLWLFELGYGVGNQDQGLVASLGTNFLPGATIRATYRQAALGSNRDNFFFQVFPSFSIQPDITLGDRRFQNLRTRGGFWIQPFIDQNSNGILDEGEEVYTKNSSELLSLNNRSLKNYSGLNITPQAIILPANPGVYRLGLDPAGYPLDYQPQQTAYAVEAIAGSYTTVLIPFIPAYRISGTVTHSQGKVLVGARVEAIALETPTPAGEKTPEKRISVTDEQGEFYLENLQQGRYQLQVNGQPAQPDTLFITETSSNQLTINLTVP